MTTSKSRVRLTAGRIEEHFCPPGKSQAFKWDTEAPALAVRVTPTGRKTYVFESRLKGATLLINISAVADWPLDDARAKAKELAMMVDAAVMGHKPCATAEGYRPRTVDALRPYLKQIGDLNLKMTSVEFDRAAAKSGLRLVSAEL